MFYFSTLDQKKLKIEWGRAVKKTFKKKSIEPFFGKNIEGDEIEKSIDLFKKN